MAQSPSSMTKATLQKVLQEARGNPALRRKLINNPREALRDLHIPPSGDLEAFLEELTEENFETDIQTKAQSLGEASARGAGEATGEASG